MAHMIAVDPGRPSRIEALSFDSWHHLVRCLQWRWPVQTRPLALGRFQTQSPRVWTSWFTGLGVPIIRTIVFWALYWGPPMFRV